MDKNDALIELTESLNNRLDAIEAKLDAMRGASRKGLEWIGMLSEHIESLDEFRCRCVFCFCFRFRFQGESSFLRSIAFCV